VASGDNSGDNKTGVGKRHRNSFAQIIVSCHPLRQYPMKTKSLMIAAACIVVLAACSTPYQQVGTNVAGGFYSERIAENRFVVSFVGNGFTQPKRASDFAMLRAAETTLEYHFTYFAVDGRGDLSRTSMVHMGSTSTTTGTVSPYGTYTGFTDTTSSDMPVFKQFRASTGFRKISTLVGSLRPHGS
jgi:hypothetical protein